MFANDQKENKYWRIILIKNKLLLHSCWKDPVLCNNA